jgi:hypothetical protein
MVARLVVIGQPGRPVFFALLLDDLGAGNDRSLHHPQMDLRARFKACRDSGQLAAAAAPLRHRSRWACKRS